MTELDYYKMEELDKEWSAWLNTVPWEGYGSTIAESNRIFCRKRNFWIKKMVQKHGVSIDDLNKRYNND